MTDADTFFSGVFVGIASCVVVAWLFFNLVF
jgi:hypothetical protein